MRRRKYYGPARVDLRGFTFIELILVVIVLSSVVALSVPHFRRSFHNLQVQVKADELAYLMRYAQVRAVAQRRPWCLNFDEPGRRYWLSRAPQIAPEDNWNRESADSRDDVLEFERIPGQWGRTFSVPGVEVRISKNPVTFYPDGRVEKTAISLCGRHFCSVVSTQQQRGRISVFHQVSP